MASVHAHANGGIPVYTLESVVRGHHIYKRIWTPHVGEKLQLQREDNENDLRAVAVLKDSVVVGQRKMLILVQ